MAPDGRRSLVSLDLARLPRWDAKRALTRRRPLRLRLSTGSVGCNAFAAGSTSVVVR